MSKYNIELTQASLSEAGIATSEGWVTVYNVEPTSREFRSVSAEFLPVGVGLPAHGFSDKPDMPEKGFALVRSADGSQWEHVTDNRGLTAWDKDTREQVKVTEIDLPPSLTFLEPHSAWDRWDGTAWVTDAEAQRADELNVASMQKKRLLDNAQQTISTWQTELQLEMISDEDKARLTSWMEYIKRLQQTDITAAPNVEWPSVPA